MISDMVTHLSESIIVVVVLLIVSTYAIADDWDHVITVDGVNGADDTMCINGSLPCATLNMALKGIKDKKWYNVCIEIRPGNYILEYGEENEMNGYNTYESSIAITGSGMKETAINCEPSAGLFIATFNQVRIDSVSFHNCGYCCHNDTAFQKAQAAIIAHSSNIAIIDNVALYNSNGSGIILLIHVDSNVTSTITNSLITGGTARTSPASEIGGGIIAIIHIDDPDLHLDYYDPHSPREPYDHPIIFNNNNKPVSPNKHTVTETLPMVTQWLRISHSSITNNNYSAVGTIFSFGSTMRWATYDLHLNIDNCIIMDNSRGFYYYYKKIDGAVPTQYVSITETHLSSLSNTSSLIEMPDNMILHFDFIDVSITDILNVSKQIGKSIDRGQCYGDVLAVKRSCSKHETCHFPEILFSYMPHAYDDGYISGPGLCSNKCIMEYYKGHHCPIQYSVALDNGTYSCWDNHQGELCGKCIEGHSVAINSPSLACVPCNDTMTVLKGWGLLIVLEFIPITVMVAVIAVLNVNLNQGSLKPYIFLCQILTIPFPSVSYPSWFVIAYSYKFQVENIALVFLAIWNLGFVSYPASNDYSAICISHKTTTLGAFFFWYLIAFYPFILLFLLYSCVLAYDRGFRCVVCVMRPVHRLLARFWRKFNIQPSLPHTIASMYTLCFTQLAATSLKLLHFTTYDNQLRFFYDGSQRYFSGWHGAAGTLALIVLIVFIIVPVVYLSVYPFMWFQKYLNKVKIRKDLLISVTDVFTAPYNNGTKDTLDYRYYASSHFILQLLVMVLYYIPSPDYNIVILALQVCCCTLFLISLVMFRPYKRKIHEFTEAILLLVLITFSLSMIALQLYYIGESAPDNYLFETSNFIIVRAFYPICALFFLISFCFCCGWFIRKYNRRQRVTRKQLWEAHALLADGDPNDQSEDDAILADRIANPDIYNRK